ncbi:MAG: hypothetical protein U1F98_11020 [Verrucomicrobiota bacterium]
MKSARFYVLMILVLAGCAAPRVFVPPPARVTAPPELLRSDYLCEVLRYLNQWELDEVNRLPAPGSGEVEIWVRPVPVKTDEGDRSSFAEMWFPGPRLLLHLKRSDADLPERHSRRRDACYKIRAVERGAILRCGAWTGTWCGCRRGRLRCGWSRWGRYGGLGTPRWRSGCAPCCRII